MTGIRSDVVKDYIIGGKYLEINGAANIVIIRK